MQRGTSGRRPRSGSWLVLIIAVLLQALSPLALSAQSAAESLDTSICSASGFRILGRVRTLPATPGGHARHACTLCVMGPPGCAVHPTGGQKQ